MLARKFSILFTLFIALSLLLSACAGEPQTIIETVTVVETVEKIVEGETVVETVEVIKTIEVEVTPIPEEVGEPGEDEVVTLTFWGDERGRDTAATRELHYQLARAFEETHPNTKVAVSIFPSRGFSSRVVTAIAAGQGPDIWYHYYATDVATQGFLEDLTPYIEASGFDPKERWFNIGNIRGLYDGKYYAVPRDATAMVIGYNKGIFDAAGVPYPEDGWTLADMREKAIALTDSEKGIYGLPSFDSGWFQWHMFPYNMGVEPGFMSQDGKTIQGIMDSPEALEAYRFIMDLDTVDQVTAPKGFAEQFGEGYEALSGGVGMFFLTTWERDEYLETADFEYGIVELPSFEEGGEAVPWTDSYMFYLNADSPHKQRAWEFLDWVTGSEGGSLVADSGVWTPGEIAIWEEMGWTEDEFLGPIYQELMKPAVVLNYERSQFYWDCVGGIWDEMVGKYVDNGETNLEDYMPDLVAAGQACLDENYAALEE